MHGPLSPRHRTAALALQRGLGPLWVLERGEQGAVRWWEWATQGRVDALGWLVCLVQLVPALPGNASHPLGRVDRRGLGASCSAASPAGVGAGVSPLPPSPTAPMGGLNGETWGHWGLCASRALACMRLG